MLQTNQRFFTHLSLLIITPYPCERGFTKSHLKYSYLVEFVWRDAHEADDVSVVGVVECDHLFGSRAGGGKSQSQIVSLGARVDEENNFQL